MSEGTPSESESESIDIDCIIAVKQHILCTDDSADQEYHASSVLRDAFWLSGHDITEASLTVYFDTQTRQSTVEIFLVCRAVDPMLFLQSSAGTRTSEVTFYFEDGCVEEGHARLVAGFEEKEEAVAYYRLENVEMRHSRLVERRLREGAGFVVREDFFDIQA